MVDRTKKPNVRKRRKAGPWNKGKAIGQKAPIPVDAIQLIRRLLAAENNKRDLALFNTAIDSMLRESDLVTLQVGDVTNHQGRVLDEGRLRQKKTDGSVIFSLSERSRDALQSWIDHTGKDRSAYLFTSTRKDTGGQPISTAQFRRLVKKWVKMARLDPAEFSGHSTRRSKTTVIYRKTQNLAACQNLLGHRSISSTALYLGVGQREALELAKDIDV